ncbi:MAG: hypothetical protein J6L88_08730 [Clostridia bacterium]|nr:hypothetical protein [Clostridia bacterium]
MANGTFSGVTSNRLTQVRISWSAQKDDKTNTSRVTASLQLYKTCAYASRTYGTGSWTLKIGENTASQNVSVSLYEDAGWVTVMNHEAVIPHDAGGTKSITISASGGISGTTLSSISCSRTVALDAIDRKSAIRLAGTMVYAGDTLSFDIEAIDASFTHTVTFSIGDYTQTLSMETAHSGTFTVPRLWCCALPCATSGQGLCRLETYAGTVCIGKVQTAFTLLVPEDILPALSDVEITEAEQASLFIQNKSRADFHFENAAGVLGSSIQAYVVKGVLTSTEPVCAGPVLSTAGNVTYQFYVIDTRGRQSDVIEKTIFVHAYAKPTLYARAYRCDENGQSDNDGAYLLVQADFSCSVLDGSNTVVCEAFYQTEGIQSGVVTLQSGQSRILGGIDPARSWEVILTAKDSLGAAVTYTLDIAPSFRLINANAAVGGIAFGRMSSKKALQCALDAEFDKNLQIGGKLQLSHEAFRSLALTLMPVGYIYVSRNDTDPSLLFGGSWQRICDVFPLAAGDLFAAGETGGSVDHTLTTEELPAHTHTYESVPLTFSVRDESGSDAIDPGSSGSVARISYTTAPCGGGTAHNNMPPYLALYMWERTA